MNTLTKLSELEIEGLKKKYPSLPSDYFGHLLNLGWGEGENGRMVYSAPIEPKEIFPNYENERKIVLLGNDFQGYCFGIDLKTGLCGEINPKGEWEEWSKSEGFKDYIS